MSTINEVCNFFGVTRQTIHAWQNRGVIRKPPRRGYDLQEIAQAIVADWIATKAGHGDPSSAVSLSEARTQLAREQTEATRIKNMFARGELVRLSFIQRSIERVFTAMRERLLSIPGKVASSCEMRSRGEVEQIVSGEIYEALEELSRDPTDDGRPAPGSILAFATADDNTSEAADE